jgi:hypothetical protein
MALGNDPGAEVTADLIEAIRSFPVEREVEHCGTRFVVAPFDVYADWAAWQSGSSKTVRGSRP